ASPPSRVGASRVRGARNGEARLRASDRARGARGIALRRRRACRPARGLSPRAATRRSPRSRPVGRARDARFSARRFSAWTVEHRSREKVYPARRFRRSWAAPRAGGTRAPPSDVRFVVGGAEISSDNYFSNNGTEGARASEIVSLLTVVARRLRRGRG